MISEKDERTRLALEAILSIYIEGVVYNNDHLGYWKLLSKNIIEVSTYNLKGGITDFYAEMETSPNARELIAYNLRVLTRMANSEVIKDEAIRLYTTFKEHIDSYRNEKSMFDLLVNGYVSELCILDKILFFIHIYSDQLTVNLLLEKQAQEKALAKGKRWAS